MEQRTDRLHPSLKKNKDLEKRLEKKVKEVNSFNNHINNIKELITYFKGKKRDSEKKIKKFKTVNTVLESVDTIVIVGATSTSLGVSITGIGLIILPISAGIACTLSIGYKVLHRSTINKKYNNKKQYEKDQQTINSSDKLYRKSWQDNVFDKYEN